MRCAQVFRLAFAARGLCNYTDASVKKTKTDDDNDDESRSTFAYVWAMSTLNIQIEKCTQT